MTDITAAMVKELRDATSAGMMECKRALQETDGDFDEADYVIPGNDDAIRSCSLVIKAVADGIEAGRQRVTQAEITNGRGGAKRAAAAAEPAPEPEPEVAPAEPEPEPEVAADEEGAE